MKEPRPGCYYCFRTLDPQDTSENHRTFVACADCKTLYHESCFGQGKQCLHCGSNQAELTTVKAPQSLYALTKPSILPIKPSVIVYSFMGKEYVVPEFFYKYLQPTLRFIWRKSKQFTKEYIIPAYHKHAVPAFRKIRNRIEQ